MGVWNPGPGATAANDTFTGDQTNEIVDGLGGDDALNGGGGEDRLTGNSGNDTINPGDDYIRDVIFGGTGMDTLDLSTLTEDGVMAQMGSLYRGAGPFLGDDYDSIEFVRGTQANDRILGTSDPQFDSALELYGLGGDDWMVSFGGVTLFGGPGRDLFSAATNALNNVVGDFEVGVDYFVGTIVSATVDGADTLLAFSGSFTLRIVGVTGLSLAQWQAHQVSSTAIEQNSPNVANLAGTSGVDWYYLGGGNDVASGAGGDDIISGGLGADTINGGAGDDRIEGGSGNDTIVGGADNDTMDGGSGDDSLQGGDGIDTASYVSARNGVTVNLATVGSQATGAGADTLTGIENLTGSAFGDSLAGTAGANVLSGLGGDDTLAGGAGADTLDGGGGFDVADYGASSSGVSLSLASGLGSAGDAQGDALVSIERVLGSGHADVLVGAASADTLEGASGDDILQGGAGDDTLRGGIGNDQVNGGLGADTIDGGDGFDTVRYDGAAAGVTIYVDAPYANTGEATGDVLTSIEGFVGSTFNDYMVGGVANNVLQGFVGADILEGHGGDDLLDGGDGDDNLQGGLGGDILDGGAGFDVARYDGATAGVTIYVDAAYANTGEAAGDFHISIEGIVGSTFNDYLVGGVANNILQGYVGDDILEGHGGDDLLDGGDGNDQMNGGTGGDIFDGGAGFDTVRYDGATAGVIAFMTDAWANTGEAAGDAYISIEALYGSNFNDTLAGASNSNELQGFDGVDFLYGYGAGDFLGGGDGDDYLDGGAGADTLRGDAGNDQFIFRAGEGNGDQVLDFSGNGAAAGDNLLFLGYGTAAQGATFVQIDATHWQINSADGLVHDIITIANGASIDASDFIFGP